MKFGTFVSRLTLVVILFAVGFAVRQVIQTHFVSNAVAIKEVPLQGAVPAVRGVLYDGGFNSYAAVVDVDSVNVYASPDSNAKVTNTFPKVNKEGAPQTFLVTGQQQDGNQAGWYQVLLPVRPNESKGWVRASDVHVNGLEYRIDIHEKSFKIDVYKDNVLSAEYPIGLGTDKTPTPEGLYSVIEVLKPPTPNTIYGTHVLGLNGYSDVETDWPDGGHIAIHGTNSPSSTIGKKVSHGCVRLKDANIDTLAAEIPLGTPVNITND